MTTALKILKKATPAETEFYFKTLYPLQDTALEAIQNEGIMMATGDLIKNPYLLEGEALILQDIDETEFKAFIKKLVGDLIGYAKARNVPV